MKKSDKVLLAFGLMVVIIICLIILGLPLWVQSLPLGIYLFWLCVPNKYLYIEGEDYRKKVKKNVKN